MGKASSKKKAGRVIPITEFEAEAANFKDPGEGAQPAAQEGMPFDIGQLFAQYGATKFENDLLRAQLQRAQQQVITLQNMIMQLEAEKPAA